MFIGAGPRSVARVTTSFGLARSIGDLSCITHLRLGRAILTRTWRAATSEA